MSVGSIDLDLELNYREFNSQLNSIAGRATNMVGDAFKKLGGIIAAAFAVGAMMNFAKEAINLASDLQEVQNVVDVTFAGMENDINNWSKTTLDAFGLSELSAKKYSSTLGAMLKSSGLTGPVMKDMSKNLTELSADMASFYNLSNDFAFEKIRAGISGETEPLKQLGINMSVANMEAYALSQGITTSYQKMNQASQSMLRYQYLMSVTGDAQGDFARTSNSWANQVKLMGEQWRIFQGTMGAGFINILTPIVRGLNFVIKKLQVAALYFKYFTELIFGAQNPISTLGGEVEGLGDSSADAGESLGGTGAAAKKAAKATKKAAKDVKGSLSSFDMLNVIGKEAADSLDDAADAAGGLGGGLAAGLGAGLGLGGLGDMSTPEITVPDMTKFQPVIEMFKQIKQLAIDIGTYLANAFGPPLKQALEILTAPILAWKDVLIGVFKDIATLWSPLKEWLTGDLVPFLQKWIVTVAEIWAGLIETGTMIFKDLWDAIFPILQWFVTKGLPLITDFATEWIKVIKALFDTVKSIFDKVWSEGVKPGLDLVSKMAIDALNILKDFWDKWGKDIVAKLVTYLDNIKKLFGELWDKWLKPSWDYLLKALTEIWDSHLKGLIVSLTDMIGKLVTGALDIFNKFVKPIMSYLIDELAPTFKRVFNFIVDVLKDFVIMIIDIVKGIVKVIGGIIDFIVGVFTGDWQKAWNGIKTIFSGVWDIMKGLFKGISAVLGDVLEYLIGSFTAGWKKAWDGIKSITTTIGDAISGAFKGTINGILDAFNWMIKQVNKVSFDIPDFVPGPMGGQTFGLKIPSLPKLAKGGLATAPTLAMVGDNKNASVDPEVITPLSKLQGMLGASNNAMTEVLLMILQAIENQDTSVSIDGDKLTRIVRDKLRAEGSRVGTSGVTVGGVTL